jgi:predicted MFS family arabinose efflux permease
MHPSPQPALPASFNRLAWSNLAAQSAEQIAFTATAILAVLSLGADAGWAGLLQTAQTLPLLLFAIPAGVLADRMSRRRLMAYAEAVRLLSLVLILGIALAGGLSLPLLAALSLAGACGTVAYGAAAPSVVQALVPPAVFSAANARIELARTVAFTAGPALAGALIGWKGAESAFVLAAVLSSAGVLLLARLEEPPRPAPREGKILADIKEGARFVLMHPMLRPVFVTQVVFNAAFSVLLGVFAPYAVQHLGLSASGVGFVLGVYGAGMLVGALLSRTLLRLVSFGVIVALGPVLGLAASIVMVSTLWVPSALLATLSFFLFGVGPILWVISTATMRQAITPPQLLGRVSSIYILAQGARPVGAAIGALVGALGGAELCLVLAALGFAAQAVVILVSPAVRLSREPEAAALGR